jgi:hypothetical protein
MLGPLLGVGIPLFYLAVGMGVFRTQYVKQYTEYLRWQNERPDAQHKSTVYGNETRPRRDFSWDQWKAHVSRMDTPAEIAVLWIFYAIAVPIYKLCHPTVKVPSQARITEITKELDKL